MCICASKLQTVKSHMRPDCFQKMSDTVHLILGSTCPIDGQFFRSDGSGCPPTCDNPKITCGATNVPGCHCPPGQLIDTVGRTCFTPDECPGREKNC